MVILKNKRAYFDYEILEKYTSGIILEGWEVKSIRAKNANVKDAFVIVRNNEAYVVNMYVSRWKTQSRHEPINETRERKLLLKEKEINELEAARRNSGMTILVLDLLLENNLIKLSVGVGRGRKKYDKRQRIREREQKKDIVHVGKDW